MEIVWIWDWGSRTYGTRGWGTRYAANRTCGYRRRRERIRFPRVWSSLLNVKREEEGIPGISISLDDSLARWRIRWGKEREGDREKGRWVIMMMMMMMDLLVSGSSVTFFSPSPRRKSSNLSGVLPSVG